MFFFSALSLIVPFTTQLSHDYDQLDLRNSLTFFGNFGGLSFIPRDGFKISQSNSSTLLEIFNGTLNPLLNLGQNEQINDICVMNEEGGGGETIYFGGDFSLSLGDGRERAGNIIGYQRQSQKLFSLGKGLNGKVRKLYCDSTRRALYAAGDFTAVVGDSRFGSGIMKWEKNSWIYPPGKGVSGSVYALELLPNGREILLGGDFSETADGAASLSPLPLFSQDWKISASGGGSQNELNSLRCSANNGSWLLPSNATGDLNIEFGERINVTMIKLFNLEGSERGIKTFSVYALDSNQLLTLKYLDAETLVYKTCEECTLKQSAQQEFFLSSLVKNVPGLKVTVKSWYGLAGGLKAVEVYHSTLRVHAVNQLNTPLCASLQSISRSEITGNWISNNGISLAQTFLSSSTPPNGGSSTVTFSLNIPSSGLYEVWLVQPSCSTGIGGRCDQRGSLQVSIITGSTTRPDIFTISQASPVTRVLVSTLFFEQSTGAIRPAVTITFSPPAGSGLIAAVNSIEFLPVATRQDLNGLLSLRINFEDFGSLSLRNVSLKGPITALAPVNEFLYLAGNLQSNNKSYYLAEMKMTDGSVIPLNNDGPNGLVNDIKVKDKILYLAGRFNQTLDSSVMINKLAIFNLQERKWSNLTTNDIKGDIFKLTVLKDSDQVHVMGNYSLMGSFPTDFVENYGVLNVTSKKWTYPSPILHGKFYAGGYSEKSQVIFASGIFNQTESLLSPRFYTNYSSTRHASLSFASEFSSSTIPAVSTGVYYNVSRNGSMMREMIIAAEKENKTDFLAFNSVGSNWTEIHSIDNSASVVLSSIEDMVLITGNALTESGEMVVKGPMLWNASSTQFLSKEMPTDSVVHTVKAHPNGEKFVIGGKFDPLEGEDCESLCSLKISGGNWESIGKGLKGEVYDMEFHEDYLIVVGYLTLKAEKSKSQGWRTAIYNLATTSWKLVKGRLPGPPSSLAVVDSNSTMFIAGTATNTSGPYVYRWDGVDYENITEGLAASEQITRILITNTKPLNLVAVGKLLIGGEHYVAALWNQTSWIPLVRASRTDGHSRVMIRDAMYIPQERLEEGGGLGLAVMILIAALVALIVSGFLFFLFLRNIKRRNQAAAAVMMESPSNSRNCLKLSEFVSLSKNNEILERNPLNYKLADYDLYMVRYAFEPQEQWGLPLRPGDRVYVLDNTDKDWWIGVLDQGPRETLRQGVFPSSCVTPDFSGSNSSSFDEKHR